MHCKSMEVVFVTALQRLRRGSYGGEGTIFGHWSIGDSWSGPFALSPDRSLRPPDLPVVTISARPPTRSRDGGSGKESG